MAETKKLTSEDVVRELFSQERMTVIAVINPRGGVGRTTAVLNLGYGFYKNDAIKSVLLIDLDPKADLTKARVDEPNPQTYAIGNVLKREIPVFIVTSLTSYKKKYRVDVVISSEELAEVEASLWQSENGILRLNEGLQGFIRSLYHIALIDCPSGLGLLNQNALAAADYVIIPVKSDVPSMRGMVSALRLIKDVRASYNPDLKILGILNMDRNEEQEGSGIEITDYLEEEYGRPPV